MTDKRNARGCTQKMGNTTELNQLEQHLLEGLQSEKERLANLSPIDRLALSDDADPEEILSQYEQLVRNYHPKNYSQHKMIVSETAKAIVELLDEAKQSAAKKWEDTNLSSDISEIAFAATQSTDDLPEPESTRRSDEAQTIPSYEAMAPMAVNPGPQPAILGAAPQTSDLPQNPYFTPTTGDLPHIPPSQSFPMAPAPINPNFAVPNPAMARPVPNPVMARPMPPPPPVRYPTQDLPPHPVTTTGYAAIPTHPISHPTYPTRDLPPLPAATPSASEFNELQSQVRVLNHRALTAETRMRTMERVHREQVSLLESQLLAAVHRAEQAEQRVLELEGKAPPNGFGQFPPPPILR